MPSLESCALPLLTLLFLVALYLIVSNQRDGYTTTQRPTAIAPVINPSVYDSGQTLVNLDIAKGSNVVTATTPVCADNQRAAYAELCKRTRNAPQQRLGNTSDSYKRALQNSIVHGTKDATCGPVTVKQFDFNAEVECRTNVK